MLGRQDSAAAVQPSPRDKEPASDNHDDTSSDVESQKLADRGEVTHWQIVSSQTLITEAVLNHKYHGSGTTDDPYQVEFIPGDPRNPMNFPAWKKWSLIATVAVTTLAVAFVSTAYTSCIRQIIEDFQCSREVATLGISLFVLGWALGPLIWAPLSEICTLSENLPVVYSYGITMLMDTPDPTFTRMRDTDNFLTDGRQYIFFFTYALVTIFNAGAAGVRNIESLIVMRFLAGIFGASPMTNAGGVVADLLNANQRGLGMVIFTSAPFLGPAIGPIVGGFASQSIGWRWVEGIMAIFTGVLWMFGAVVLPETYAPVILKRRTSALSKQTGKVYISILEKRQGKVTAKAAFNKAMTRPWILLFREPIVMLLSIYMAIIYGTLYMMFGAFPVVFQEQRGWSQGVGGLAFVGLATGIIFGLLYCAWDNKRYREAEEKAGGEAKPEVRLPPTLFSAVLMPVGMFWFAFSNGPSVHWAVSITATVPFGFGMVAGFLSMMNYLIDSYVIYAASVLAASTVLRSLFGAAFPMFTPSMYERLGIHWASAIPAFAALACVPFPFLFYKYGERIRMKCKYAAEAAEAMAELRKTNTQVNREEKEKQQA